MSDLKQKKETFSGGFAVFFATLGSAVGLGNIWKFPYVTGQNGGAAFLLIYLGCVLLVGVPILIAEYVMGRHTRGNVVSAYTQLGKKASWKIPGFVSIAGVTMILLFYTAVAGWTYFYFFQSVIGGLSGVSADNVEARFLALTNDGTSSVFWQFVVITVVSGIICLGVRKGIEGLTKKLMPLLLILVILCVIQSLMLPNSWGGVEFLFKPDFSKLTADAILVALGLAFFKLSLGMGCMITYGSYFHKEANIIRNAGQLLVADTTVSMLAGLAIFPAVFAFGMEPGSGPGLLFMTVPLVFSKMPFGGILTAAFFFLSSGAATMAIISMFEVVVAYLQGNWRLSRVQATGLFASFVLVFGSLAALSASPDAVLGKVLIGGKSFFDCFDYLSSNILLPLGGIFTALLVGWVIKPQIVLSELTNQGKLFWGRLIASYFFILRYVAPILVIIVFLRSLDLI